MRHTVIYPITNPVPFDLVRKMLYLIFYVIRLFKIVYRKQNNRGATV